MAGVPLPTFAPQLPFTVTVDLGVILGHCQAWGEYCKEVSEGGWESSWRSWVEKQVEILDPVLITFFYTINDFYTNTYYFRKNAIF